MPWTALAVGAGLAIVVALPVNLLIRAGFLAAFDISDDFEPLASFETIFAPTIVGILFAALGFALVIRLSARPIRTYQIVVLVGLLVSLLTPAAQWISDDAASGPAVLALALMHIVTAGAVLAVLIPFVRRRMGASG